MASSRNGSILPILLISTVIVLLGYLVITKILADNVAKANPKPQVEELTSSLKALRKTQDEVTQNRASTPLPPAQKKSKADNFTGKLNSQIENQEKARAKMMQQLKGKSGQ